jgi:hypothetical protein
MCYFLCMARSEDAQQLQLQLRPSASRRSRVKRTAGRSRAAELIKTPGALLTRTHLRQLGFERRAIDAIFRALPVVALPGYSRPMVRVEDYLQLVERNTYRDDRVRPV